LIPPSSVETGADTALQDADCWRRAYGGERSHGGCACSATHLHHKPITGHHSTAVLEQIRSPVIFPCIDHTSLYTDRGHAGQPESTWLLPCNVTTAMRRMRDTYGISYFWRVCCHQPKTRALAYPRTPAAPATHNHMYPLTQQPGERQLLHALQHVHCNGITLQYRACSMSSVMAITLSCQAMLSVMAVKAAVAATEAPRAAPLATMV
jgi:hypothetical protein